MRRCFKSYIYIPYFFRRHCVVMIMMYVGEDRKLQPYPSQIHMPEKAPRAVNVPVILDHLLCPFQVYSHSVMRKPENKSNLGMFSTLTALSLPYTAVLSQCLVQDRLSPQKCWDHQQDKKTSAIDRTSQQRHSSNRIHYRTTHRFFDDDTFQKPADRAIVGLGAVPAFQDSTGQHGAALLR